MSGPPKDVKPSALFLKLSESPRPSEVVPFPRRDEKGEPIGHIRIQVLRMEDHEMAQIRAYNAVKPKFADAKDMDAAAVKEIIGDAAAKELLAMACLEPEPVGTFDPPIYPRIFRNGDDVKKLAADEVTVLFNHYITIQHKYGPFERTIESDADLNDWIKRLGEGARAFPLAQLTLPQLVELCGLLARRAYTLSCALQHQWSSLPPTLQSLLESCSLDTGFYGSLPAASTQESLETDEIETLTREAAEAIAERMRKGE
jgi:hypothetical protein